MTPRSNGTAGDHLRIKPTTFHRTRYEQSNDNDIYTLLAWKRNGHVAQHDAVTKCLQKADEGFALLLQTPLLKQGERYPKADFLSNLYLSIFGTCVIQCTAFLSLLPFRSITICARFRNVSRAILSARYHLWYFNTEPIRALVDREVDVSTIALPFARRWWPEVRVGECMQGVLATQFEVVLQNDQIVGGEVEVVAGNNWVGFCRVMLSDLRSVCLVEIGVPGASVDETDRIFNLGRTIVCLAKEIRAGLIRLLPSSFGLEVYPHLTSRAVRRAVDIYGKPDHHALLAGPSRLIGKERRISKLNTYGNGSSGSNHPACHPPIHTPPLLVSNNYPSKRQQIIARLDRYSVTARFTPSLADNQLEGLH
ncbi:hypothetical protein M405DRAFT_885441 [Rhizopogon salebrosus TDB-379]|nr:hypothetical protein M405DRAFT_885441 [Rhizopogon salebrosus TDB-379]